MTVEDCRTLFLPLSALTPPPAPLPPPPALHVNNLSWTNDDLLTLDMLIEKGLSVTLDGVPTGPVDSRNFLVTVAMPYPVDPPAAGAAGGQVLLPIILAGTVARNAGTLTWSLPANAQATASALSAVSETLAASGLYMQGRVTLKGDAIMGTVAGTPVWLDGKCFGKLGTRFDGSPRVEYAFPSGDGVKASDFESWFSVAPIAVPGLTISPASVTLTAASPSPSVNGIVTLTFNALTATTVTLTITGTQVGPTVIPAGTATSLQELLGPTSPYVSIPASVSVPKAGGTASQTFAIKITQNPGNNTSAVVTIKATAQLPSGIASPIAPSATLTIIGFTPPPAGTGFNPNINLENTNLNLGT